MPRAARNHLYFLLVLAGCSAPTTTSLDAAAADDAPAPDVSLVDAPAEVTADAAADAAADVSASGCLAGAMQILEGDAVVPQTLVHLTCDAVHPASVTQCTWTLLMQPLGSAAQVQPAGNVNQFTLAPNVAGTYTLCPTAHYSDGAQHCALACETVIVLPDKAIHAELTWDTPGAATATDADPCKSAQPQLHFAHPYADDGVDEDCDGQPDPWFDAKYDCYSQNCSAGKVLDWGSPDPNVDDNPDLNAFDGGPDNLDLMLPEDGKTYRLGVVNPASCGPTTATLRVYVYGALQFEDTDTLQPLDLWNVGTADWPDASLDGCNAGNLCKPGSGKGKCVTPCYKPPPGLSIPGEWTSAVCP